MSADYLFYRATAEVPAPQKADPMVLGSIPQRAAAHCEPLLAASGYGWNIFAPCDFDLIWDGQLVYWRHADSETWLRLGDPAMLPMGDAFSQAAPAEYREWTHVPFLARAPEPGIVQIWSGLIVASPSGWASHIAPPSNYPRVNPVDVIEGIIETDWWFGPLITPVRILKTDVPLAFRRKSPYCQLKPIKTECFRSDIFSRARNETVAEGFDADRWANFAQALKARNEAHAKRGSYRKEATRVRKSEG